MGLGQSGGIRCCCHKKVYTNRRRVGGKKGEGERESPDETKTKKDDEVTKEKLGRKRCVLHIQ